MGCSGADTFPYGKGYRFLNRYGDTVELDSFKGKVLVVSYIYTNCPDACPLTVKHLKDLRESLPEGMDVPFVLFSIDPHRDRPEVLMEYALKNGLDSGWTLLTGDTGEVGRFLKDVGVVAVKRDVINDSTYFLAHTDYVCVVDAWGRVVFKESGKHLNIPKILSVLRGARP